MAILGTVVDQVCELLETPELVRPDKPVKLDDLTIRLKDVSFSYHYEDKDVLHGVNLTIKPGTMTALVGPSGSSKSTIAKLITGYWDVTGGSDCLCVSGQLSVQ